MKILVTQRMPESVLDLLRERHEVDAYHLDEPMERSDLIRRIPEKDGLLCFITDKIDEEVQQHATGLKMIANLGVGFDNIQVSAATSRKIPVSNTPGVLTDATADLTFALILAVARRVTEGDRMVREGRFHHIAPLFFLGTEVSGKTLGVVGLGRIGKAVARRAAGFNMRVMYFNRSRLPEPEERSLGLEYASLDKLLGEADFVSIHVPLTPQTRHLIGENELGVMKNTAFLINTSRGPVIDEQALVKALQSNGIRGAGLDVYEKEPELAEGLKELENVVLMPHVGSATLETRTKMAQLAAYNLLAGLEGRKPPNCLNCDEIGLV
jgi:glyoxylate reductase